MRKIVVRGGGNHAHYTIGRVKKNEIFKMSLAL